MSDGSEAGRKPLKRLIKSGAVHSGENADPDLLTDALAGLSLTRPPQGKFAAKVASLKKIAGEHNCCPCSFVARIEHP